MVYKVIGLMSGSSLDGLDIAYVEIAVIGGKWSYELIHSACTPYTEEWKRKLQSIHQLSVPDFLNLHTEYGRYLGEQVNTFIDQFELTHKVHLIASHGHTAYHNPAKNTTFQLGEGGTIAAVTQLNVVSDLRNKDVAHHGQGAPIVPIAEKLLWNEYDFCLNVGGIANITINQEHPSAFDICTANQVLNYFAQKTGQEYDHDGQLAAQGIIDAEALTQINSFDYFNIKGPKSLSNDFAQHYIDILDHLSPQDASATMCEHISLQIKNHLDTHITHPSQKILITGGGAYHQHLISRITSYLDNIEVVVAEPAIIEFKEAIAMALIGVLRWREEENVLSSVTGAERDSVAGALWVN